MSASHANYETLDECVENARFRGYTGAAPERLQGSRRRP